MKMKLTGRGFNEMESKQERVCVPSLYICKTHTFDWNNCFYLTILTELPQYHSGRQLHHQPLYHKACHTFTYFFIVYIKFLPWEEEIQCLVLRSIVAGELPVTLLLQISNLLSISLSTYLILLRKSLKWWALLSHFSFLSVVSPDRI